jgi:hypothetical protein
MSATISVTDSGGASRLHGDIGWVTHLPDVVDHLRTILGHAVFADHVGAGAVMDLSAAVRYARQQIQAARRQARCIVGTK